MPNLKAIMPSLAFLPALAGLAACTTTGAAPSAPVAAECDASAAQPLVGQRATSEMGARALDASGARMLRWAPPRSALTMDYRADRLTVSYDDDMIITEATCG